MIYLRFVFLMLFCIELYQLEFKKKADKYIWFIIVLVFGLFGYSFYLAFRRRLVLKRKFSPNFNNCN